MILSNEAIRRAILEKRIFLDPSPREPFDTTAVDLRLGEHIRIPKENLQIIINPRKGIAATLGEIYKEEKIPGTHYCLEPGNFILGQTLERIDLPLIPDESGNVLAARVEGKSSLARCGLLVHFTAPTIHAGFQGNITLEMINFGRYPIQLQFMMPICQLIFEIVQRKPTLSPSQFQGQCHPEG